MSTIEASDLPARQAFIRGLRKDLPAVIAGLTVGDVACRNHLGWVRIRGLRIGGAALKTPGGGRKPGETARGGKPGPAHPTAGIIVLDVGRLPTTCS